MEQRLQDVAAEKIMEKASDDTIIIKTKKPGSSANSSAVGLLINADVNSNDPVSVLNPWNDVLSRLSFSSRFSPVVRPWSMRWSARKNEYYYSRYKEGSNKKR